MPSKTYVTDPITGDLICIHSGGKKPKGGWKADIIRKAKTS